jgi:hypothetical protein
VEGGVKKIKPWSERWEFENKGADRAKNEEISELRARVFELEVALRFYSNPEVYRPDTTGRCDDLTFVARAALEG